VWLWQELFNDEILPFDDFDKYTIIYDPNELLYLDILLFMKDETHLWEKDNHLVLDLNAYPLYEDVPIIAAKLQRFFKAKILERLDGPAERIWHLEIDGCQLALYQVEAYGCFLKATTRDAKMLKEIKDQWALYS